MCLAHIILFTWFFFLYTYIIYVCGRNCDAETPARYSLSARNLIRTSSRSFNFNPQEPRDAPYAKFHTDAHTDDASLRPPILNASCEISALIQSNFDVNTWYP